MSQNNHLKPPYIKLIKKIARFEVWCVDGGYIRQHINPDFTNFNQHYDFTHIPRYEFWVDQNYRPSELDFFITTLLWEHRLMRWCLNHSLAHTIAVFFEKRARWRAKKELKNLKHLGRDELLAMIRIKLLSEHSANVKVWLVNGELVRDLYWIDFTEGGHDYVYRFIPHNEIWLEDGMEAQEQRYVLIHELHERILMAKGMQYNQAHDSACEVEVKSRYSPREVPDKIMELLHLQPTHK